ncbi:hypothetical protein BDV23DRAFT_143859 [Aspergillus alliaceus]|uniref:Uncharacterized protein n=1 Tax=Petromyces alliaceus TaxID=209559 RepID=A0A5N7CQY1_PETAA|nr:hypothetical protein BDV23DRAFT_143859 [Aspergillus alliaceus]
MYLDQFLKIPFLGLIFGPYSVSFNNNGHWRACFLVLACYYWQSLLCIIPITLTTHLVNLSLHKAVYPPQDNLLIRSK